MHHAAAQIQNRALGLIDHLRRLGDFVGVRRRRGLGATRLRPVADGNALQLHVFGDVHQHRAGAARQRQREGARNHFQQRFGAVHQKIMLGDRHAQAIGVHLLKGVGADHALRHLAGDGHQRDGIQLGVGNRGQQIGGARAGRGQAHRRLAGGARHALGDKAGALFVAGQHVVDFGGRRQGVVKRQDGAAGNARQHAHTLALQQTNG